MQVIAAKDAASKVAHAARRAIEAPARAAVDAAYGLLNTVRKAAGEDSAAYTEALTACRVTQEACFAAEKIADIAWRSAYDKALVESLAAPDVVLDKGWVWHPEETTTLGRD